MRGVFLFQSAALVAFMTMDCTIPLSDDTGNGEPAPTSSTRGDGGARNADAARPDAAGLDAARPDATGLDAAGLDAAGLDAAGSDSGVPTGDSGSGGSCGRPVGACTTPATKVTDVSLGIPVTGYGGEGDTEAFPMAIAAMPSGGSRIAWLGTDGKVYVARLDCDDKLVGTPVSFPGVDLQDILADDDGGVVLLTRDATNGGADNCGTGTLCGGSSSPCRTMWMVRFDDSGNVKWETQVTNLTSNLAGYQDGARFVWWYQHHGRLAFSGSTYAAFFSVAITVNNGSCVDIHEGDRLQLVSSTGALIANGSLAVGMSHAWTSRILWDPRANKFQATDATDNNCRIANPAGAVTVASSTCDGKLFNGDVVMASSGGYWNAWSNSGTLQLDHFTTGGSDKTVTAGSSQHPHLVTYGPSHMLLTWSSGSGVAAQVRSSGADAATVGAEFAINVADHDFGAWKAYPDGSAAYAASGSNSTSIKVARVLPCQ